MTEELDTRVPEVERPDPSEDDWVRDQLEQRPTEATVEVDGISVAYRHWTAAGPAEPPGRTPTTLLIHGNGAHSGWWDAIAPTLARTENVVGLDLSGHGGSGWRDHYDYDSWAREAFAVLDAVGAVDDVVVVGHSMGGLVSLTAAWSAPERIRSVITLDTPLRRFTAEQLEKRIAIARRPLPVHPSRRAAVESFKTMPPLTGGPRALVRHVAESSVRRAPEGWVLRLDPRLYSRVTDVESFLRPYPPLTHLVQAGQGLLSDEMVREMRRHLPDPDRVTVLPAAGHNLVLEIPREVAALVARIRRDVRAARR